MIDLDAHIRNQRIKLKGLDAFLEKLMMQESHSLLSEVKQGVREKGVPGEEYSEGYSAYRRKKGRQTAKVDLTFTNRMMNNTQIRKVEPTGQSQITAFIGPSQEGEKKKFKANQNRYGNFLKPNSAQRKRFQKRYIKAITKYFSD